MKLQYFFITIALFCYSTINCFAGVMPSQSRVVYEEPERDKSLMLANTNNYPVIVQAWIDNGEGTPDSKNIPFVSVPPVFRLEPSSVKGIRIIYNNQLVLPQDKESLFWFNIYEIPPEKGGGHDKRILVAMNTQIKLFYRPNGIRISPEEAIKKVSCRMQSKTSISCQNPSPIHISVINVKLASASKKYEETVTKELLISPFSQAIYQFYNISDLSRNISVWYVDDAGNQHEHNISVGD